VRVFHQTFQQTGAPCSSAHAFSHPVWVINRLRFAVLLHGPTWDMHTHLRELGRVCCVYACSLSMCTHERALVHARMHLCLHACSSGRQGWDTKQHVGVRYVHAEDPVDNSEQVEELTALQAGEDEGLAGKCFRQERCKECNMVDDKALCTRIHTCAHVHMHTYTCSHTQIRTRACSRMHTRAYTHLGSRRWAPPQGQPARSPAGGGGADSARHRPCP